MRYLQIAAALAIAVLSIPVFFGFLEVGYKQSTTENTRALWYDEAYVALPAYEVWKKGPAGFRCFSDYIGGCYGGLQVTLDAVTLQYFTNNTPSNVLQAAPELTWPWQLQETEVLKVIRLSRLAYATLLVVSLLIATLLVRNWMPWHFAFWLATSAVMFGTWQGAKNDYPSAFVGALFMIFVVRAFMSQKGHKSRDIAFVSAVVIGSLCLVIRPWIVPPLGLFFLIYPFWEYRQYRRKPWMAMVIASTLASVIYLIFSPNSWHSYLEATWLKPYLFFVAHESDLSLLQRIYFFGKNVFLFLPPLFFVLKYTEDRKKIIPIMIIVGVVSLLVINNPFQILSYILAPLALLIPSLVLLWKTIPSEKRRKFELISAGIGIAWVAWQSGSNLQTFKEGTPHFSESFVRLQETSTSLAADFAAGKVAVDLTLHAPIPLLNTTANLQYFDSLSLSPSQLAKKLPAHIEKILVTCWSLEPETKTISSPAANSWQAMTRDLCSGGRPLNYQIVLPYQFPMNIPIDHIVFTRADFEKRLADLHENESLPETLSPRVFQGGENIRNYYDIVKKQTWQAMVDRPTRLRLEINEATSYTSMKWTLQSFCAHDAKLTVKTVTKDGIQNREFNLSTRTSYCQKRPFLCSVMSEDFLTWLQPEQTHDVEIPLGTGPQKVQSLDFNFELNQPCYVISNGVRFFPSQQ